MNRSDSESPEFIDLLLENLTIEEKNEIELYHFNLSKCLGTAVGLCKINSLKSSDKYAPFESLFDR